MRISTKTTHFAGLPSDYTTSTKIANRRIREPLRRQQFSTRYNIDNVWPAQNVTLGSAIRQLDKSNAS